MKPRKCKCCGKHVRPNNTCGFCTNCRLAGVAGRKERQKSVKP